MNMRARIVGTQVALAAAGLMFGVLAGWGSPAWWAPSALALAVILAEAAAIRLVVGREGLSFALSDAFIAVGFVLAPGAWIPVAVAVGVGLSHARKLPQLKLSFNIAQYFFNASIGVAVAVWVGGGLPGAYAGLAVFALGNHLVVALPVALTTGMRYDRVLLSAGPLGIIYMAGNASVGLLAGWLCLNAPWGLLGLVVPLGLLWWSFQQQALRASEARLFAELARGQERAAGGTVDSSTQVVVTAAARLFGGAEVELVLRHPDGPVRYLGDENGVRLRQRGEGEVFDAPWVLRALAARRVLTGADDDRPFCSAVLGDAERPLAILIARRPPRAGGFTRDDVQLAEVLVGQAEAWLSYADLTARHEAELGRAEVYGAATRVLGDLGAETVPALALLRESANRLSRLAAGFEGPAPVTEIVTELHAVERAVASLLGAIALASDHRPDARSEPVSLNSGTSAPSETEWTTTGRLEDVATP